jgi:hypothetical protein
MHLLAPLFLFSARPPALARFVRHLALWFAVATAIPRAALATENGTTAFPNGLEDYLVAGMPPPGWYGFVYFNHYAADRVADNAGRMAVPRFDLKADVVALRLDWVKPVSILGADRWGTLLSQPIPSLDLTLSPAPGVSLHGAKRGLGDLALGNGLHWTFPKFEMVNAVDLGFPTGDYRTTDLINPGMNRWVVRLNHMGTWHPAPDWDVSYRFHWDDNFNNSANDYHSGQTLYLNWAVGWKPQPPLTIGLAGYSLRQITDDRQRGATVHGNGNCMRVDGLGPCVKYFLPNHVMLTAKYFHESGARNGPQGDQFWCYVAVPLAAQHR